MHCTYLGVKTKKELLLFGRLSHLCNDWAFSKRRCLGWKSVQFPFLVLAPWFRLKSEGIALHVLVCRRCDSGFLLIPAFMFVVCGKLCVFLRPRLSKSTFCISCWFLAKQALWSFFKFILSINVWITKVVSIEAYQLIEFWIQMYMSFRGSSGLVGSFFTFFIHLFMIRSFSSKIWSSVVVAPVCRCINLFSLSCFMFWE